MSGEPPIRSSRHRDDGGLYEGAIPVAVLAAVAAVSQPGRCCWGADLSDLHRLPQFKEVHDGTYRLLESWPTPSTCATPTPAATARVAH
jgi:hypothetical protein